MRLYCIPTVCRDRAEDKAEMMIILLSLYDRFGGRAETGNRHRGRWTEKTQNREKNVSAREGKIEKVRVSDTEDWTQRDAQDYTRWVKYEAVVMFTIKTSCGDDRKRLGRRPQSRDEDGKCARDGEKERNKEIERE